MLFRAHAVAAVVEEAASQNGGRAPELALPGDRVGGALGLHGLEQARRFVSPIGAVSPCLRRIDCMRSVSTACMVESIAAVARGILERHRAGSTVQVVVAAVQSVVPGDLAPGDLGRKQSRRCSGRNRL